MPQIVEGERGGVWGGGDPPPPVVVSRSNLCSVQSPPVLSDGDGPAFGAQVPQDAKIMMESTIAYISALILAAF